MNKNENALFGCIGLIAWVVVLFVVSAMMNGWALMKLWTWFVLPVFESAPTINIVQAIGIGMVVSFLTHETKEQSADKNKSVTELVISSFIYATITPLLSVFFGWIVTLFL